MDASELLKEQVAEEGYQDPDGKPILLETLVRKEPGWAANIIRWSKAQLAERTRERDEAREAAKVLQRYGENIRKERDDAKQNLDTAMHALKCCANEACHCADALDALEEAGCG